MINVNEYFDNSESWIVGDGTIFAKELIFTAYRGHDSMKEDSNLDHWSIEICHHNGKSKKLRSKFNYSKSKNNDFIILNNIQQVDSKWGFDIFANMDIKNKANCLDSIRKEDRVLFLIASKVFEEVTKVITTKFGEDYLFKSQNTEKDNELSLNDIVLELMDPKRMGYADIGQFISEKLSFSKELATRMVNSVVFNAYSDTDDMNMQEALLERFFALPDYVGDRECLYGPLIDILVDKGLLLTPYEHIYMNDDFMDVSTYGKTTKETKSLLQFAVTESSEQYCPDLLKHLLFLGIDPLTELKKETDSNVTVSTPFKEALLCDDSYAVIVILNHVNNSNNAKNLIEYFDVTFPPLSIISTDHLSSEFKEAKKPYPNDEIAAIMKAFKSKNLVLNLVKESSELTSGKIRTSLF
jgi:hypothetical protein